MKAGGRAGLDEAAVEAIEARLERDREILSARVFGELADYDAPEGSGLSREQVRQIGKRAAKVMAELAEVKDEEPPADGSTVEGEAEEIVEPKPEDPRS